MRIPLRAMLVALVAALLALTATTITPSVCAQAAPKPRPGDVQPLERAHAHNDYEHDRPLLDALDHGFTSVEADVWLVDGDLYLGHDAPDLSRRFEDEYLRPLLRRVQHNAHSVYRGDDGRFRLYVDVKSGPQTWATLERILARYPQLVTTWRDGRRTARPVEVVVSGDRDLAAMQSARVRRSAYDGRLTDLRSGRSAELMPVVSDNWTKTFTWQGVGPMPEAERAKLQDIVATAHRAGYEVRFWATPDLPGPARHAVWRELVAAGVDQINTDDLAGLQAFLLANDPTETQTHLAR